MDIYDILTTIFKFLSIKQIGRVITVSKLFNDVIKTNIWDHAILIVRNGKYLSHLTKNLKISKLYIADRLTNDQILNMDISNITFLDLTDCRPITDACIEYLSKSNIKYLNISFCRITDIGLKYLSLIKTLYLDGCDISDNGIKVLKCVESLSLAYCMKISCSTIEYLSELTSLNLSYCNINDENLKYISSKLKFNLKLKKLNLSRCKNITSAGLKYLTMINSLDLEGCENISDIGINSLISIKSLDLSYCKQITDEGLKYLSCIESLNLAYCDKISDKGIKQLYSLKKLNIINCNKITDIGLQYLTNLRKLEFSCSEEITVNSIKNLTNIQELTYGECHNLTDGDTCTNGVDKGFAYLINLRKLSCSNCFCDIDFEDFTSLRELKLYCYRYWLGIKNLTQLTTLKVNNCHVLIDDIKNLSNLTRLDIMDSYNYGFTIDDINKLYLPLLEEVNID